MIRLYRIDTGASKDFGNHVLSDGSASFDFDNDRVTVESVAYYISLMQVFKGTNPVVSDDNPKQSKKTTLVVTDDRNADGWTSNCNSILFCNTGDYTVMLDNAITIKSGESMPFNSPLNVKITQTWDIAFTGSGTNKRLEIIKETIQ